MECFIVECFLTLPLSYEKCYFCMFLEHSKCPVLFLFFFLNVLKTLKGQFTQNIKLLSFTRPQVVSSFCLLLNIRVTKQLLVPINFHRRENKLSIETRNCLFTNILQSNLFSVQQKIKNSYCFGTTWGCANDDDKLRAFA